MMAFATVMSRILGLVRVVFSANILGGGVLASAWFYTFMIPNLFRRLLGEGALGSALVPIISYTNDNQSKELVRTKLTIILAFLSAVLGIVCIGTTLLCFALEPLFEQEYIKLILQTVPLIIPYAFFICLVGAITAVLNSFGQFFWPAMGALILNFVLIGAYVLVCPDFKGNPTAILNTLSIAVLLAGVLQLLLVVFLLRMTGMLPVVKDFFHGGRFMRKLVVLRELWRLMIPGLIGAGALQISMFIDKTLALWLGDQALPALTYSDRIVYLPIGVFAVSFGTVALSQMSHSAAKKDYDALGKTLLDGLKFLLVICMPITLFIISFRESIIRVLFLHGEFDLLALQETSHAMFFYAMGIPAFAAIKISVSAFHARKDMKTPVKVAMLCIFINLVLNLILMWPLKQGGLALATVISSVINNLILLRYLKSDLQLDYGPLLSTCKYSLICSLFASAGSYAVFNIFTSFKVPTFIRVDLLPLTVSGIVFVCFYFWLMNKLKSDEIRGVINLIRRR